MTQHRTNTFPLICHMWRLQQSFLFFSSLQNSPRRARAIRRLGSELDTVPEDDSTPDSGTSSLESPKKPLSAR